MQLRRIYPERYRQATKLSNDDTMLWVRRLNFPVKFKDKSNIAKCRQELRLDWVVHYSLAQTWEAVTLSFEWSYFLSTHVHG